MVPTKRPVDYLEGIDQWTGTLSTIDWDIMSFDETTIANIGDIRGRQELSSVSNGINSLPQEKEKAEVFVNDDEVENNAATADEAERRRDSTSPAK